MLNQILFYSLERAIKRYRKFAQTRLDQAGIQITIDQWLVLRVVLESEDLTQREIGERIFKDQASVARIVALLLARGLLASIEPMDDARRVYLRVTDKGEQLLEQMHPIVLDNRRVATQGLSEDDIAQAKVVLERISENLSPEALSVSEKDSR